MQHSACAIILAGGRGTRIRHLRPDVPKPFVRVAGKPFVEWAIRHLADQGCQRFVVSLGHLAEIGQSYFAHRADDGLRIATVVERQSLGTGGAARLAAAACTDADVLVVTNGDSLVLVDRRDVWSKLTAPDVDGALVGVEMADASRYGRMDVDPRDRLVRFCEKEAGPGLINAGVYFLKRRLLERFPGTTPLSMEQDVFPSLVAGGARLIVHRCRAPFLDIGTPESLAEADRFVRRYFTQEVPA
ncbi:MAG: NTP transferase domain-containing protein [Planctomycetia bacterium]|nr:NTP transferase domain-containing protein [Planctomycetia bacterium]